MTEAANLDVKLTQLKLTVTKTGKILDKITKKLSNVILRPSKRYQVKLNNTNALLKRLKSEKRSNSKRLRNGVLRSTKSSSLPTSKSLGLHNGWEKKREKRKPPKRKKGINLK